MTILVGERSNRSYDKGLASPWNGPDLDAMVQVGAFRSGRCRDLLENRVGLRWDAAVNLLPPSRFLDWNNTMARHVAACISQALLERFSRIVLCGRRVQRAFFNVRPDLKVWNRGSWFCIPHPSGLCHEWNDPAILAHVKRMLGV